MSVDGLHNDLAILKDEEDKFNYKKYADVFFNLIDKSDTPYTISINGGWGEGKTSLLHLIENKFQNNQKYDFITIDAWNFSTSTNISQDFINFILNKLLNNNPTLFLFLSKDDKKDLIKSGMSIINLGGQIISGYIKTKIGIELNLKDIFSDNIEILKRKSEVRDIKSDFEKIISKVIFNENKINSEIGDKINVGICNKIKNLFYKDNKKVYKEKIIIAVDNLDRIDAEKSIEIIETLKKFLDIKGVVFIFVIDQEIIKIGLKKKFDIKDEIEEKKYLNYFDKIIQVNFKLPKKNSSPNSLEIYLKHVFSKYITLIDSNILFLINSKFIINGNPRAIKKLYNNFLLISEINSISDKDFAKLKEILFLTLLTEKDDLYLERYVYLKYSGGNINDYSDLNKDEKDFIAKIYSFQVDKVFFDQIINSIYETIDSNSRISENDLLVYVLKEINNKPNITTSEIIKKLEYLAKGKDAEILSGRRDTYLSQKIRNLVSHKTLEKYANFVSGTENRGKQWVLNDLGKKYLEENLED